MLGEKASEQKNFHEAMNKLSGALLFELKGGAKESEIAETKRLLVDAYNKANRVEKAKQLSHLSQKRLTNFLNLTIKTTRLFSIISAA